VFKSNAVRSCVELHEIELNRFYETWQRFLASATPLPGTADPSYRSADHLGGHVFRAARGYLTWIGECVKRPVTGLDADVDSVSIAHNPPSLRGSRGLAAELVNGDPELALPSNPAGRPGLTSADAGHAVVHPETSDQPSD
jgi:hypothetical protein